MIDPGTSSATTTSRRRSTGRCRPAGSPSRATRPAPRPTAATRRRPSPGRSRAWSRARLRELGATVRLTRHSNRQDRWGPCVDVRGRAGNSIDADLKLSVHADGSYAAGARGFHVIAPADRAPWTDDIHRRRCGWRRAVKAGLRRAAVRRRDLHRRRRRARRPLRPRHPQPLRRPDRDGRARQHAQRGRGAGDDLARGRARYAAGWSPGCAASWADDHEAVRGPLRRSAWPCPERCGSNCLLWWPVARTRMRGRDCGSDTAC